MLNSSDGFHKRDKLAKPAMKGLLALDLYYLAK
jgi:hypothetical protein